MKKIRSNKILLILTLAFVLSLTTALLFACAPHIVEEKRMVTFMNGDEVYSQQEVKLGEKYSFPSVNPAREQPDDEHLMEFVGWTLDPNYYEYRSEILTEPDFVVANLTIYAAFRTVAISDTPGKGEDLSYNVEFRMPRGEDFGELSGTTLTEFSQEVKRYGNAVVPTDEDMPQIKGYHFTGEWVGGTLQDIRGNRRVTAVYEKNTYNYVWHYLGETSTREVLFRDVVDLTEQPTVEDAFVFDGWYTDSEFQTKASLTEIPDGDVELYAKYHIDFSTVTVAKEGTMVYGDSENNLFVTGLKECEGLEYTFEWKLNDQSFEKSAVRNHYVKDAGDYVVSVRIYADYKDGTLLDSADAKTEQGSTQFVYTLDKATLNAVVTLSASSVEYGSEAPVADIVYSGFVFGETAQEVGVGQTFVYMQGDAEVSAQKLHAGTYRVETIPTVLQNYKFATIDAPVFTVTAKDLTVSAKVTVQNYTYGDGFAYDVTFDGFVEEYGDNVDVLGEHWFTLDGAGKYVGGELFHAGDHAVQLCGYASNDYNVLLPEEIEFTVAKRHAEATLFAEGGIYGVIPQITYTFDNVLKKDEERFVPTYTYRRATNPYTAINNRFVVGDYTVDATFAENDFDDYEPLIVTGDAFTIVKKQLKVSVSVQDSYTYGDKVNPSPVYEQAFEFGESQNTEGLVKGNISYRFFDSRKQSYTRNTYVVDTYTVEAFGISSDNYEFVFEQGTFSVTKKSLVLTVSLVSDTVKYGETDKIVGNISYNGFVEGESASSVFGKNLPTVYYTDAEGQTTSVFHAGTYTATTTADPQNYAVTVVTATLNVVKRSLFVGITLNYQTVVYGNKPSSTIVYRKDGFDGFVPGEQTLYTSQAYVLYSGEQSYTQNALVQSATKMSVGNYTLSVQGIDETIIKDYEVTYQHQTDALQFSVTPAQLTVTVKSDSAEYTYGETPRFDITIKGFAYDENAQTLFGEKANTIVYMSDGKQVQVGKYINVGSYTATLNGIENSNYTVEMHNSEFRVDKKELKLQLSVANFVYGGAPSLQLSYNGFVEGENTDVLEGSAVYSYKWNRNAGEEKQSYSPENYKLFQAGYYTVSVGGFSSDNYNVVEASDDFTVSKRNFTVTVTAKSITYGDAPDYGYTTTVLEDDKESFDFRYVLTFTRTSQNYQTYDVSAYPYYQAGNYRVNISYTLNPNYNEYAVQFKAFTVSKKTLTVGVSGVDASYVYGEKITPHLTFDGWVAGESEQSKDIFTARPANEFTYNRNKNSLGVFDVGDYTVSATRGYTTLNYNVVSAQPTSFNVTPKALKIGVTVQDIIYGATPAPKLVYEGLLEGDEVSLDVSSVTYTYEGNLVDGVFHAGEYQASVSGITSRNYTVTFGEKAQFSVGKKDLAFNVTVVRNSITYGEHPVVETSYNGFVLRDDTSALNGALVISVDGDAFDQKALYHGGEHNVTLSGYSSDDYTISYGSVTFTVNKKVLTHTLRYEKSIEYGTEYTPSVTFNGFVEGESVQNIGKVEFSYGDSAKSAGGFWRVGTHSVSVEGLYSEDYEIPEIKFSFEVTPRTVTIQFNNVWKTYADDIDGFTWYTLGGDEILNDGAELRFETSVTRNSVRYDKGSAPFYDAGNYVVTVSYVINPDYTVKQGETVLQGSVSNTFTIQKRTINANMLDQTVTFANCQTWQGNVSVRDPQNKLNGKLVIKGDIVLKDAQHADVTTYSDTSIGDHFVWKNGEYTISYNDSDITDNIILSYNLRLAITSAFLPKLPSSEDMHFVYDKTAHRFEVTATADGIDQSEISVEYSIGNKDNYSAPVPEFSDAGTYTVYYKISAKEHPSLTADEGEFVVTIDKKEVKVPDVKGTVYNATLQKADVVGTDEYEVSENNGGTNADSYNVVFKLIDVDNYKWMGEEDGQATVTRQFVIAKATLTRPSATAGQNLVYNGTEQEYLIDLKGQDAKLFDIVGNKQKDADDYSVTITLHDDANYKWASGAEKDAITLSYSIAKATLTLDKQDALTFTFDGSDHFVAYQQTNVKGLKGDDTVTLTYSRERNGSYTDALTLRDYSDRGAVYVKADAGKNYNIAYTDYSVTVIKADYNVSVTKEQTHTYDKQAFGTGVVVSGAEHDEHFDGSYTLLYNQSDSVAPQYTNWQSGGYTVDYSITGNANYNDVNSSYKIVIEKRNFDLTAVSDDVANVYDNTLKGRTAEQIKALIQGVCEGDSFTVTVKNNDSQSIDAVAEYDVSYEVGGNANYNTVSATYKFAVAKAKPEINFEDIGQDKLVYNSDSDNKVLIRQAISFEYIYDDNNHEIWYRATKNLANGIVLTSLEDEGWVRSIDDIQINGAGEYTLEIKVQGDNYTEKTISKTIEIAKAEGEISVDGIQKSFVYNGTKQTVTGASANHSESELVYEDNSFTDVPEGGKLTFNITLPESDNYKEARIQHTITINKAQARIGTSEMAKEYTYNGNTQTVKGATAQGLEGVELKGIGEITYKNNTFLDVPEGGKQIVTIILSEGDNYLGETIDDFEITINKAEYTVKLPEKLNWTYDGVSYDMRVTVTGVDGNAVSGATVTYSGEGVPSDAQIINYRLNGYEVTYTVAETANYKQASAYFTVKVDQATPQLKSVDNEDTYTYDKDVSNHVTEEEIRNAVITGNVYSDAKVTFQVNDGAFSESIADGATKNANKYTITVHVEGDNYVSVKDVTYTFTVLPKHVKVQLTKPQNTPDYDGTYDGTPKSGGTIEIIDDAVLSKQIYVTYPDGRRVPSDNIPSVVNAGTYKVDIDIVSTSNYYIDSDSNNTDTMGNYSYSYYFVISKATFTVEVHDVSHDYDGISHFFNIEKGVDGVHITGLYNSEDITVTYSTEEKGTYGDAWDIINVNESCDVWYIVSAGDNYNEVTGSYHVTVKQAMLTELPEGVTAPTIEGLENGELVRRWGRTLASVCTLPDHWKWQTNIEGDLVKDSYTLTAIYTDPNGNYLDYTVIITFTTRKEKITIEYGGDPFETIFDNEFKSADILSKFTVQGEGRTITNSDELQWITASLSGHNLKLGSTYLATATVSVSENKYYALDGGGNDITESNVVVKVKSVQIGENWYTIEDALNVAKNGTITVKYNTSFAEKSVATVAGYIGNQYYTIKEGVTLFLPYDVNKNTERGVGSATGTSETTPGLLGTINGSNKYNSARGDEKLCDLKLILPNGIAIQNEGTINIGGITSGGGGGGAPAGQTASGYAKIVLGNSSSITSKGIMNVFGFIEESSLNNGSKVTLVGGSLTMPFVVVEHRGGGAFLTMIGGVSSALQSNPSKNLKTSPFNRFYMENVHPILTISGDASLIGHANLYANDKDNVTNINVIGSNKGNLIQLDGASKVIAKYNTSTCVTDLEIKGNATLNALSLKIEAGEKFGIKISAELNTEYVYFPISWYYNITLSKYEDGRASIVTTTSQKIKLLPGATLTVSSGVTLRASEIVVYNNSSIADIDDPEGSYEKKDVPAVLIVNGTLTADSLAGEVQTNQDGAIITFTNNTITTTEVKSHSGSGLSATVEYKENIIHTLCGKMFGSDEICNMAVGTYYSKNGEWISENQQFTVQYKFRLDNGDGTFSDIDIDSVVNPNSATYAWKGLVLQEPTSEGLIFIGWYLDANGVGDKITSINGDDNFGGVTVYGIFKEVKQDQLYTIEFNTSYNDNTDSGLSIDSKSIPVDNIDDFLPDADATINEIITAKDYDVTIARYFDNWYLDKDRTIPYSAETVKQMYSGGETVTLYAGWKNKVKLTVQVEASGKDGFLGIGAQKSTATAQVTIGSFTYTVTKTSDKNSTPVHDSKEYYLKPGQEYTITATEGNFADSSDPYTGTAEEGKDIFVLVTHFL